MSSALAGIDPEPWPIPHRFRVSEQRLGRPLPEELFRAGAADGQQSFPEAPHSDSPITMLHPMLWREMTERRSRFESPPGSSCTESVRHEAIRSVGTTASLGVVHYGENGGQQRTGWSSIDTAHLSLGPQDSDAPSVSASRHVSCLSRDPTCVHCHLSINVSVADTRLISEIHCWQAHNDPRLPFGRCSPIVPCSS